MKYVKTLGLFAVAAVALMVFAGTASATITSPAGTQYGWEIRTISTNSAIDGTVDISCELSEYRGTLWTSGSTSISGNFLNFTNCSRSVSVTAPGSLAIASDGTIRSFGARITVQTTIFGFPVHCIYTTSNTVIGTLTEGIAPAKMHIGSAPIPQEATSNLCGDDAEWTGTYTVWAPSTAIVVD